MNLRYKTASYTSETNTISTRTLRVYIQLRTLSRPTFCGQPQPKATQKHRFKQPLSNLFLPETSEGLSISWSSSDSSVVSPDGIVKRQGAATLVNLTATITSNGSVHECAFSANVREAIQLDLFEGYAFAYFTNNSKAGENIDLAASDGNNALIWTELKQQAAHTDFD